MENPNIENPNIENPNVLVHISSAPGVGHKTYQKLQAMERDNVQLTNVQLTEVVTTWDPIPNRGGDKPGNAIFHGKRYNKVKASGTISHPFGNHMHSQLMDNALKAPKENQLKLKTYFPAGGTRRDVVRKTVAYPTHLILGMFNIARSMINIVANRP